MLRACSCYCFSTGRVLEHNVLVTGTLRAHLARNHYVVRAMITDLVLIRY